jgi:hypothetical protein
MRIEQMVGLIAAALAKPMMLHDKMHAMVKASRTLHVDRVHTHAVLMCDDEDMSIIDDVPF